MLAPFYCVITKLVQTSNTTVAEEEKGIGGMGCKLDKTKMETKSTDICAASKWHPIGGGGKPLVTLCCSFTKRRKPVEDQFPGRALPLNG